MIPSPAFCCCIAPQLVAFGALWWTLRAIEAAHRRAELDEVFG
jgi:hypothetical protein